VGAVALSLPNGDVLVGARHMVEIPQQLLPSFVVARPKFLTPLEVANTVPTWPMLFAVVAFIKGRRHALGT
jgi:hypothetical protein